MKTVLYIGASLLILVVLFIGFGFMQDQQVSVSRTVLVQAPMEEVFDQFNDLEKRLVWSPFEAQDTTMITTMGNVTKGINASYSWTSEEQNPGKIKYVQVIGNQLIESELYFGEETNKPSQGLMIFKQADDGVKVTWEVHMDMGNNPFMRILGRYIDNMMGPTFESGLESMKTIAETQSDQNNTPAEPVELEEPVADSLQVVM